MVFPIHPRTKKNVEQFNLQNFLNTNNIITTEPLDYNDFLYLWEDSCLVITDSGGLQEETTSLKVPCITVRENTERPITVEVGSNVVVGTNTLKINEYAKQYLMGSGKSALCLSCGMAKPVIE